MPTSHDILALTEPPDGGYGPLLNGLRGETVPGLMPALVTDLRSPDAVGMASALVRREAWEYLRCAAESIDAVGAVPTTMTYARALLRVARFMREAGGASWVLEGGPGALGADLWAVRSGERGAFWRRADTFALLRPPYAYAERLTMHAGWLGRADAALDASGRLTIREEHDAV